MRLMIACGEANLREWRHVRKGRGDINNGVLTNSIEIEEVVRHGHNEYMQSLFGIIIANFDRRDEQ